MISYKKFFNLIKNKKITQKELIKCGIITDGSLAVIRKNGSITLATVDRLCNYLHCQPWDILEYIPDEKQENGD